MAYPDFQTNIEDPAVYRHAVERFRQAGIVLPTFSQLAEPATIPGQIREALKGVNPDAPDPRNLFRVHWHNRAGHPDAFTESPEYMALPSALTGVDAQILVALGDRFPMIRAHKVTGPGLKRQLISPKWSESQSRRWLLKPKTSRLQPG